MTPLPLRTIGVAHDHFIHRRRVRRLCEVITPMISKGWHVLDIGSGDGQFAKTIAARCELDRIVGYDILVRENAAITVQPFDGRTIPAKNNSFDAVMLIDVLHHTDDPLILLREASRVAAQAVIVKDHRTARPLAKASLRFMDWVGNRAHNVRLPYNYLSDRQWRTAWSRSHLEVLQYDKKLNLYPFPLNWIFDKGLHFVAKLQPIKHSS